MSRTRAGISRGFALAEFSFIVWKESVHRPALSIAVTTEGSITFPTRFHAVKMFKIVSVDPGTINL